MSGAWKLCIFGAVFCALVYCVLGQAQSQNFGTGDISKFLTDENFVKKQISCVLGESSCDNYGNQLKLAIPEVITRNCRSCNAQQASNARRLISYVQSKHPQQWQKIQARYRG